MLPALRYVAGKSGVVPVREVSDALAKEFNLTEAELSELLPSGRAPLFYNRVQWAITHMRKAALFATPQRGCVSITQRGKEVLSKNPKRVDMRLLADFPEFQEFRSKKQEVAKPEKKAKDEVASNKTPDEIIEDGYQVLRTSLATDLLDKIKICSPYFFEQLVVDLILKMGYGGSRSDAGTAFRRSGDGGIDGFINEDRLGLSVIYTQAKRWADKPVGRPEVQQFQGALTGRGANKGIFITTSYFTKEAREYAEGLQSSRIILIDGEQLTALMIDYGIGVTTVASYEVKRIDSDYFTEGDE